MILPYRRDAIRKAWLYRVLTAISDDTELACHLLFKGGTCAAMRGVLNRFSVDLDFDFKGGTTEMDIACKQLEGIFDNLGLTVKTGSSQVPQYFLKYPNNRPNERNTLKVGFFVPPPDSNKYEKVRMDDIDRILTCQTVPTMFANKLVALMDRYEKSGGIAGRDLYDINYFFLNGFSYERDVVKERRNIGSTKQYLEESVCFIEEHITQRVIDQDLNVLLTPSSFRAVRKTLKRETILFLKDEIQRSE